MYLRVRGTARRDFVAPQLREPRWSDFDILHGHTVLAHQYITNQAPHKLRRSLLQTCTAGRTTAAALLRES